MAEAEADGKPEDIVVDRVPLSSTSTSKPKDDADDEGCPLPKADAGDNARGGVGNSTEEEAEKNKSVLLLELSAGDTRAGVITPRPAGAGGGWVRPPPAYGQSEMVLDVVDVERGRKGTLKEDIFSWDGAAAAVTSFAGTGGRAG